VKRFRAPASPGWKLLAFLALAWLGFAAAGPAAGLVGAFLGRDAATWGDAAAANVLLLAATWICLRLEGSSLREIRLDRSRRRLTECAAGFALGAALFALIALAQGALVSVAWRMHSGARLGTTAAGLDAALLFLQPEELIFRGYAFRQLERIAGPGGALLLSGLAFGAYHLAGSGDWAMGALFRFAMQMLGGLVFGYALLRSGGLALPIGLHWGGNWVQATLFGVNNTAGPATVWTAAVSPREQHFLAAPDVLPHLPDLLALGLMGALIRRFVVRACPEG
jgi:membrane protease YdiL (CAAX protease family)